ncbi:hypothetical protein GWI33_007298 [Rhynchophorus ferrugineus]|uniref:Uncharacterized protein n=1 Tax=Rhynchophorus ferrugineus TaxID=354439 RepID=A0A834II13_RHYFE|nr:hypothetical protein GWI33_007298 [Rhynchophorus ferrugineus]
MGPHVSRCHWAASSTRAQRKRDKASPRGANTIQSGPSRHQVSESWKREMVSGYGRRGTGEMVGYVVFQWMPFALVGKSAETTTTADKITSPYRKQLTFSTPPQPPGSLINQSVARQTVPSLLRPSLPPPPPHPTPNPTKFKPVVHRQHPQYLILIPDNNVANWRTNLSERYRGHNEVKSMMERGRDGREGVAGWRWRIAGVRLLRYGVN